MEITPEGQAPTEEVYEEPMLVEAGEFTEMTQGNGRNYEDNVAFSNEP